MHASPAYADGRIYVGSWDGALYAFDAVTGTAEAGFPTAALRNGGRHDHLPDSGVGFRTTDRLLGKLQITRSIRQASERSIEIRAAVPFHRKDDGAVEDRRTFESPA